MGYPLEKKMDIFFDGRAEGEYALREEIFNGKE